MRERTTFRVNKDTTDNGVAQGMRRDENMGGEDEEGTTTEPTVSLSLKRVCNCKSRPLGVSKQRNPVSVVELRPSRQSLYRCGIVCTVYLKIRCRCGKRSVKH